MGSRVHTVIYKFKAPLGRELLHSIKLARTLSIYNRSFCNFKYRFAFETSIRLKYVDPKVSPTKTFQIIKILHSFPPLILK